MAEEFETVTTDGVWFVLDGNLCRAGDLSWSVPKGHGHLTWFVAMGVPQESVWYASDVVMFLSGERVRLADMLVDSRKVSAVAPGGKAALVSSD
ncbi:hypothetical protein, partial [Deinococcus sp.]|uniref:hypothetical protein n=1 Tax=Deinococcus sp. TaxID=47478 RepID=UPI00391BE357